MVCPMRFVLAGVSAVVALLVLLTTSWTEVPAGKPAQKDEAEVCATCGGGGAGVPTDSQQLAPARPAGREEEALGLEGTRFLYGQIPVADRGAAPSPAGGGGGLGRGAESTASSAAAPDPAAAAAARGPSKRQVAKEGAAALSGLCRSLRVWYRWNLSKGNKQNAHK